LLNRNNTRLGVKSPAANSVPALGFRQGKGFRDLKIRPKLIVLHNLFFLILAGAVYFSLIPWFEQRVHQAKTIEISLITELFAGERAPLLLPQLTNYHYREGSAQTLQVSPDVADWLDMHPGQVWQAPGSDFLYKKDATTGLYSRMTLPNLLYDEVVEQAKITLFAALGIVYILAVLALEFFIMPRYVYRPIHAMLDADDATRRGDRDKEMIPAGQISGDEIGQIMRSRNDTVAQLRRHEDDLAQALKRLEAQDRLASLGMLSASVAHEMNTPLAVLHGSIEKVIETVDDHQTQDRLQRMLRVTKRLKTISEGLLDFARVRRQTLEPVNAASLVTEAWNLVAIDEKASQVHLVVDVPPDASVIGNADRLVQVFVNLLRNALIAVDRGGNVMVKARPAPCDGQRGWSISVEDDGPGIPNDVLPEIFDAFVSSRLDAQGTGLGLTVAQGIVDQHGGTIHASNRPGGGARLEVILKAASEGPPKVSLR
jgi:signal transduction histidine kinase